MWLLNQLYRLLALLVLFGSLIGGWFWMQYDIFQSSAMIPRQAKAQFVELKPGMSTREFSRILADQKLVSNPWYFEWLVRSEKAPRRLKAGEYQVVPGMKPKEFLQKLIAGEVYQYQLTFVEGWTLKEFREALAKQPQVKQTLAQLSEAAFIQQVSGEQHLQSLEGRLFPDTYQFPKGITDVQVLQMAYQRMQEKLAHAWSRRTAKLPYHNPYQALIVASMVEKETGLARERAEIAGVLLRRLKKRMPLQVDATVIYGLGDRYTGNLTKADLRRKTPYNTYVHRGLPPTPIAMPGEASIQAALHPAVGNSLYFVARGDGSHYFSDTLHQHNLAVREYQLNGHRKSP